MDPDLFDMCTYLATEEDALQFCRAHGLIPAPRLAPKDRRMNEYWGVCGELSFNPAKPKCHGSVTTTWRTYANGPKPQYRCVRCKKQTSQQRLLRQVRSGAAGGGGTFFASVDAAGRPNVKVSKASVLWILYCMMKKLTIAATLSGAAHRFSDLSDMAVVEWRSYVRELFEIELDLAPTMGGPAESVRIDLMPYVGQPKHPVAKKARRSLDDFAGPWLLGLRCQRSGEFRLFYVQRRSEAVLLPIVCRHVAAGTAVLSNKIGFRFLSTAADHRGPRNYVHEPGFQGQKVAKAWSRVRVALSHQPKGTCGPTLPGYLATIWWESQAGPEPFNRLLEVIRRHYPQEEDWDVDTPPALPAPSPPPISVVRDATTKTKQEISRSWRSKGPSSAEVR
ncbi:uncharacterized protein LOC119089618 [Pollicipes pollicipes]|uniref:uncharacterized protein LOC119089618 n=1 Tax=Pollicipes pollicipes TaxID=41117 RepID=UPI001884BCE7|nr:uncharacterized protein LOC119089618 [Pollicipes pollicipes]XP_037068293.1 uncharacterized protein LOC119089618 [Pollicipes pollicipes]XP_037068294.1 uncharacterized protein LOC119089618 [Pollicipes pollicipes]